MPKRVLAIKLLCRWTRAVSASSRASSGVGVQKTCRVAQTGHPIQHRVRDLETSFHSTPHGQQGNTGTTIAALLHDRGAPKADVRRGPALYRSPSERPQSPSTSRVLRPGSTVPKGSRPLQGRLPGVLEGMLIFVAPAGRGLEALVHETTGPRSQATRTYPWYWRPLYLGYQG